MKLIIILMQILLLVWITYQREEEEEEEVVNESNDFGFNDLYEKLKSSANPSELSKIKELMKINRDLKSFENQLIEEKNSSSALKYGLFNLRIADYVTRVVTNIAEVVDVRTFFSSLREGISSALTCLTCNSLMSLIFIKLFSADALAFAFIRVCSLLDLTTNEVCEGYVNTFKDQIQYIRSNTRLQTNEMCGLLMGDHCFTGQSPNLHWKLNIPKNTNKTIKSIEETKKRSKIYKILQITDIHLDLDYVPITENNCRTPYCCRINGSGVKANSSLNYWGSYPCDTPVQTLDNWFRHIDWKEFDWIYWTGDVTPHDSWQESRFKSLQTSQVINNYLKIFAKKKIVVPVFGNHVPVPVGSYPPPGLNSSQLSISWLYDDMAQQWSQWLPSEALDSLRYGGYYTLKMRSGFRIIVLNTNYCARLNIWTLYQSIDPSNHLKWLIKELSTAEEAGDLVHIVGHIPPDNRECTQSWLYNYMAIVERYSDTIVGQFFGHTHFDEFRVLYSVENSSKPIGLEIISPSLTTYAEVNPGYRVISCKQNGQLTDIETFAFDLRDANSKTDSMPKWFYEYSMAKTYSLKAFDGIEFDRLIRSFDTNEDILQMFYNLSHRNSSYTKSICDNRCKSKIMNNTIIVNPFQQKPKPIYEKLKNIEKIKNEMNFNSSQIK